jgi:hypothetical protein
LSSQGVAACAKADALSIEVLSADSAAAIKKVLAEIPVIVLLPVISCVASRRPTSFFEQITNAVISSIRRELARVMHSCEFVISRSSLRDYVPHCVYQSSIAQNLIGMIRMNHVMKFCLGVALSFMTLASAQADDFKLVSNQRIACGRGLSPGKLNTATCKSYAYLFNAQTSEYFRCQVTLALTRDNKEVINVQTDGSCAKRPRIFETDGNYSFDATETEPPNTNAFFGPGGFAVWASDNGTRKVRGCITIASGLGTDVSKCLDMTFQ